MSVKAHVVEMGPVKRTDYQDEPNLAKQEGTLVDETASIRITLWGSSTGILKKGKTYIIETLRLRKYESGELYVNSPKNFDSTATETEPFTKPLAKVSVSNQLNINQMTVNILGVNAAYKTLSCARPTCDQKVLPSKNGNFATCTSCKMLQKQNSCNLLWMAKLYV